MSDRSLLSAILLAPAAAFGLVEVARAVGRWEIASALATAAVASGALAAVAPGRWPVRLMVAPGALAALAAVLLGAFAPPYPPPLAAVAVGAVAGGPVALGGIGALYRRRPAPLLLLCGALLASDALAAALAEASPGPGAVGAAAALHRTLSAQADGLAALFGHGLAPQSLPLGSAASLPYAAVALLAVFAALWSLLAPGLEAYGRSPAPRPFWQWWAPSAGAAVAAAGTVALAALPVTRFVAVMAPVAAALVIVLAVPLALSHRAPRG